MTKVTRGVELKYIMESFIDKYNIQKQNHKLVPIVLAFSQRQWGTRYLTVKYANDRITQQALSSPATLHIWIIFLRY